MKAVAGGRALYKKVRLEFKVEWASLISFVGVSGAGVVVAAPPLGLDPEVVHSSTKFTEVK